MFVYLEFVYCGCVFCDIDVEILFVEVVVQQIVQVRVVVDDENFGGVFCFYDWYFIVNGN